VIAFGISAALAAGVAASPALAGAGTAGRIKGDGRTANVGLVSVEVRQDKLAKGRLSYRSVDGRYKVRCKGFDTYVPRMYVVPGPPAATVTADCELERPRHKRTPIEVEAEFVDNSSFTRGAKDEANLTFTLPDDEQVTDSGRMLSGDITVR
jgi:hypothetical protein